VSRDDIIAELPEQIQLDLAEAGVVLAALDRAAASSTGEDLHAIRTATRLVTAKLWPELGDLLGEDGQ